MTLGERLVKLRNEKCLSQGALAEALGVSRQSVSKWETDASVPELDKLVRLSDLFEISLDELVRGKAGPGEPPVGPPQTPEEISWPPKFVQLYRERAHLLGWLMVAWGFLCALNSVQVITNYFAQTGWENTVRFLQVSAYNYLLHALKLVTGLFIVFRGRHFSGRFRWYHLGCVLVILGAFGFRHIRFIQAGLLERLMIDFFFYLRYYGFDKMMEQIFSYWPESLGNLLVCALGVLILILGRRNTEKKNPRS